MPNRPRSSGAITCPDVHGNWIPPHVSAMATEVELAMTMVFPLEVVNSYSRIDGTGTRDEHAHPIHPTHLLQLFRIYRQISRYHTRLVGLAVVVMWVIMRMVVVVVVVVPMANLMFSITTGSHVL